ncbi:hypothetical protein B0T18DRAFT_390056 [Schizothecium vesticola]|uniref:Uncharacterized protein n=1 Tax=Schizothecium vesticola TaxID=314040 RepID=A0AA40K4J5_9PEZI|nr:hypothetical protein B0T18DRAFT_390056 [Schizothecium vesticola]
MVVYEKTHDYVERVTSIMYNMLRSGVPVTTAMQQISASLTQTAVRLYPTHPTLVSATYFTFEAARYCKTTFLSKVADGDINMKYFLHGIDDFGEPTLTEDPVDDPSSFYMGYFLRRHHHIDNPVNKQSLSEGGDNPKNMPLTEEQDGGNQQAVKKRAMEMEKATGKTATGKKATTKTMTAKTAKVREKGARKNNTAEKK